MGVGVVESSGNPAEFGRLPREHPICVHELVGNQAQTCPDAVALEFEGAELTYRQLDLRARLLAAHLVTLGVGPGHKVAVYIPRSPELVVALLGVLHAGAAYVPLDVATPLPRLAFVVEEVRSPLLLTVAASAERLGEVEVPMLLLDQWGDEADTAAIQDFVSHADPDGLAYVLYTSGTTGTPNGVLVPHRALSNYISWCTDAYEITAGAGALAHSSIAFDFTITTLLAPLVVGQRVVLLPEQSGLRLLAEALRTRHDLTIVKLTPTHLKILALVLTPEEIAGRVRTLVVGGEGLDAEALELFRGAGGPRRIVNEYGPTETVVGSCSHEVVAHDRRQGPVPVGLPIRNTTIHLVDEQMCLVPDGVAGEAVISGAGVTRGYLDRPESEARRFVTYPPGSGGRAYRTGDLMLRSADGLLQYLGRLDEQVKIGGVRVEPGEIECVVRQCIGVTEAAVVLQRFESSAPIDDIRPVAYIVAAAGAVPDVLAIEAHCREHLPVALRPTEFVLVDGLPTTTNGKLDRAALIRRSARVRVHSARPA